MKTRTKRRAKNVQEKHHIDGPVEGGSREEEGGTNSEGSATFQGHLEAASKVAVSAKRQHDACRPAFILPAIMQL